LVRTLAMKLLEMYEHARQVTTELQERQRSCGDVYGYDPDAKALSCVKALDLEIVDGVEPQHDEPEPAVDIVDGVEPEGTNQESMGEMVAARLPAVELAAGCQNGAPQSERTVEVCKKEGENRIGLQLEKCRREVVIVKVAMGGAASEALVQPGDSLVAVNGTPVSSATKASQLIAASTRTVLLTTRCLPGACVFWVDKPSSTADFGVGLDWDPRLKQLRICRVRPQVPPLPFEVGDSLISVNGLRIDASASAPKLAAELMRTAEIGPTSFRVVRYERAIAESLGLLAPLIPEAYTPRAEEEA